MKQPVDPKLNQWVQGIIHSAKEQIPETPVDDKSPMDTHRDILHLEADFQSKLYRWQDELSMDMSHILDLTSPLESLINLFQSFHIPNDQAEKVPTFHVETTLSILQSLLLNYESTLDSLRRAREAVRRLDARQTINSQRISEWASETLKVLQETRGALVAQHHKLRYHQSDRELLKSRVDKLEKEKTTSEHLVLSLVQKLNEAEEKIIMQDREKRKMQQSIVSLKNQMQAILKWKDHVAGLGIMNEYKVPNDQGSSRQRAHEYAERNRAKEQLQRGRSGERTRSRSKSRKRSKSNTPREHSRSSSKNSKVTVSETVDAIQPLYQSEKELLKSLLMKPKVSENKKYSLMYPAQSILLSKLRSVDSEITDLAKTLFQ